MDKKYLNINNHQQVSDELCVSDQLLFVLFRYSFELIKLNMIQLVIKEILEKYLGPEFHFNKLLNYQEIFLILTIHNVLWSNLVFVQNKENHGWNIKNKEKHLDFLFVLIPNFTALDKLVFSRYLKLTQILEFKLLRKCLKTWFLFTCVPFLPPIFKVYLLKQNLRSCEKEQELNVKNYYYYDSTISVQEERCRRFWKKNGLSLKSRYMLYPNRTLTLLRL